MYAGVYVDVHVVGGWHHREFQTFEEMLRFEVFFQGFFLFRADFTERKLSIESVDIPSVPDEQITARLSSVKGP